MERIVLTIPADWLEGQSLTEEELRQVIHLGIIQLRQQDQQHEAERVEQVLLRSRRVQRLTVRFWSSDEPEGVRQAPPSLPGTAVSEMLIAHRSSRIYCDGVHIEN